MSDMNETHGASPILLHEVESIHRETSHDHSQHIEQSEIDQALWLPPTDRGLAAWRLLLAAFVFEALLWGFPLSFGVFQEYYSAQPEFQASRYVSVIGTTASGISYLGAPLVMPLISRWSKYRRQMIFVGWPLCITGLIAGSFATTLEFLILTQGVLYGIGFLMFYYPILTMVDEYWIQRRGMAYGLLCSASGLSGAVMPLIIQKLLQKFGYATTLRIIAVMLIMFTGPLIPLLKGRHVEDSVARPKIEWHFLTRPLFWVYSLSNVFMGLGYFFPALYLPSYAATVGLSSTQGALLLTVMSISQVLGQFTFGYLSDKIAQLDVLIITSLTIAAASTFGLWGNAYGMAILVFYAILFGFFGAGYTAMWARMVSKIGGSPSTSQVLFGLFCFGKGLGNILAGPISAGLLRRSTHTLPKADYADTSYRWVVIFTGGCLLLSAFSSLSVYCTPKTRRND